MEKSHILREIRRTAEANGGTALGWRRFESDTGILYYDWYGVHWTRWSDAVREAGLMPNQMSEAYDTLFLVERLALLSRRLGRVPTQGDRLMAARTDEHFPSEKTFRRLGSKADRVALVLAHFGEREGFDDVVALWREVTAAQKDLAAAEPVGSSAIVGYVYLLKHGSRREYKIGRTYNPLRREGELGIQLPEKCQPLHYIQTDDPEGVEAYWHRRFAKKRMGGEFFALTPQDARAFKRWRRIY
jgi:hypothetical protein